ncbi:polysaccharide deacetylase family protein [Nitrospirillum sp. BR 11828]|uniref:polysaccharide deacetylase family protein n=1 Tax=Nitrospirillum sp. BR 11828 TaxID=3104325 RepID=UPI002ACA945D|nr:polysaccharide deacetylase family protein [Nitrospirillum sp. BR 11828]MDZ5649466.1 polysaccharide deacetylase family protein [Nitrospirillum sp. BR 11828]
MSTLPESYLTYPHRHAGPDHAHYPASPLPERPAIRLPGDLALGLWVVVPLEFFPLNPSGQPFKAPGAMQTPYPDLRHYTTRDYGNRVGAYRLLTVFRKLGLRATFAIQGAVAERYPALVRDVAADGHAICAHGWDTDSLHHSALPADLEQSYIGRTLDALSAVTGRRPDGWISPARAEGFHTPARLAAAGIRWFADWAHDDLPTAFHTEAGDLTALPLSNELDDWQILIAHARPEQEWVTQVSDAADWLLAEAAAQSSPRLLTLTIRPYVSGLPYRVKALRDSLANVLKRPGCGSVGPDDLTPG